MSNQQGDYTDALHKLRQLTNHPDSLRLKAQSYFRKEQDAIKADRDARQAGYQAQGKSQHAAAELASKDLEERQSALNKKIEAKYEQVKDEPMKNAVFLSATPFPYHKNLDYANGYLWPAWKAGSGYGPSERDGFYIDNLGYNWRYHRLETPSAEVNQDFMERELNRKLVESGAVSGRSLKLDKDYSRDFVELESGVGRKIDAALNAIHDWQGPYDMLRQFVDKYFDYHARNRLLENLKARDAVERAKKHLALGRMPEKDAALYVKNTMNFETKGKWGRQLGAMYTFAGPALFDARRMAQSLRSPRGAALMAAQFAAMYGLYGAMKGMSGTDDDGMARLNKVPLSQTGRFLTLLDPDNPDGKGYKFPVGFGYQRIALTLAAALHRYADGVDDGKTFGSNIVKDGLLSNFSPVEPTDVDPTKDLSAWAMQQFAPSAMKPLLQLAMNQNAQGSPIHKPDEWTGSKLHFAEGYPGTSALFKNAAKELHDATGVDVYPETLQYLMRSYGGNGPMEAIRAMQLMGEKAGTELTPGDMPFAQSFVSKVMNQDTTDFRQNYGDLQKLGAERKYAEENGLLDRFDAANPNAAHGLAIYDSANTTIKALYKERKTAEALEDAAQKQQAVRDLNRRIRSVQMMANKSYREAQTQ
ncbi:LPD38 domain-containing protein [Paraburkholderia caribensis]|uniref:LPD38 domain-containing protein n=1 Tax=Paraburkholderia caribensis TaxID=75105 RepID=UPI0028650EF8|nr:LPD38 domain-containing protein [Paraburkholderia caribensis]MDR6384247.1 hypothetical protein [Paraburkholderia caribensis]